MRVDSVVPQIFRRPLIGDVERPSPVPVNVTTSPLPTPCVPLLSSPRNRVGQLLLLGGAQVRFLRPREDESPDGTKKEFFKVFVLHQVSYNQ